MQQLSMWLDPQQEESLSTSQAGNISAKIDNVTVLHTACPLVMT